MKNLLRLLAVVACLLPISQARGALQRISTMTPTNAIPTNTLFESSVPISGGFATRSINFSNIARVIRHDTTNIVNALGGGGSSATNVYVGSEELASVTTNGPANFTLTVRSSAVRIALTNDAYLNSYGALGEQAQPTGARTQSRLGIIGGDASGMASLPAAGHDIWHEGIQAPQVYATLWWDYSTNSNQAGYWTNVIEKWQTNGTFHAITNRGQQPWIMLDAVVYNGTRDGSGSLVVNSNLFPSGVEPLVNFAHARGYKVEVGIYYSTLLSNTLSVGVLGSYSSTTNPADLKVGCMTPLTISRDMVKVYQSGADSVRIADYQDLEGTHGTAGWQLQSLRSAAHYAKYPGGYHWQQWGFRNRIGLSWFMGSPPAVLADVATHINVLNQDQFISSSVGGPVSQGFAKLRYDWTNTAWMYGKGHFISLSGAFANSAETSDLIWRGDLTKAAMSGALVQFDATSSQTMHNTFTNADYLDIFFDQDSHPAWRHSDDGRNSVWVKPMSKGRYAVLFGNESTTNTTFYFALTNFIPPKTWNPIQQPPDFDLYSGLSFAVRDVWNATNFSTITSVLGKDVVASNMVLTVWTPITTDLSGKANLAGGNSFTGQQIVDNAIVLTGTTAQYASKFRDNQGAQGGIVWSNQSVRFYDSQTTPPYADQFCISNTPIGGVALIGPAAGTGTIGTPAWRWDGYFSSLWVSGTLSGSTLQVTNLIYGTNISGYPLIDFNRKRTAIATNGALSFTGCILPDGWQTNYLSTLTTISNSAGSGSPILVTMPATFQRLPGGVGNTFYVTNLTTLVVSHQLGTGTNFWLLGR